MKNLSRNICLCLFVLLLAGCMTVGHDFSAEKVSKIENGKTMRADIIDWFGTPWRTGIEDGLKVWTYAEYKYGATGQTMARDLVIRFADDDTVKSYSFSSTVPGEGALR